MEKYIDDTINPGDDFFKYATGHWIDYNHQPLEYPRWGTFIALYEENNKKIEKIIKCGGSTIIDQKLNDFYQIYTNWNKRNEDGATPLITYLNENLYPLSNKSELLDYCAKMHRGIFFSIFNKEDDKNSDMNALWCWQSGLSLGNKEYYLSNDPNNKKIVRAWKKYVISTYKYLGHTDEVAKAKYKTIYNIEKKLAKVSYSIAEEQEPSLNYHKKNIVKLSKTLKFDLSDFLCKYGYDNSKEIIVAQEKVLKFACKVFNTMEFEDLKTLVEWQLIDTYLGMLDDTSRKIIFKFRKVKSGAKKDMPKKKRAISAVNSLFGEVIGQSYVKKYFSEEAKEDVKHMIQQLIISYKNIICDQDWLSEETTKLAMNKLNSLRIKVGYPDKIDDYSDIPVDCNITLLENILNIHEYFFNKHKELYYNKPVDKDRWLMNPQSVNAYYNPTTNEICFPAGILQGDFYQYGRAKELNYGGIGVVIGHEMTHGYDNHGRQYDANGNMVCWWKQNEIDKFNELTENTIKHFSEMEVIPGLHGNGELTLGENLADYGGLKIAYQSCKNQSDELEPGWEKRFFIAYATVWAGVNTEEGIRNQVLNNEHSVNFVRVNGTLQMFTPWYEAFNVNENNKLYITPDKRAKIW